jgi:hypothetical protein
MRTLILLPLLMACSSSDPGDKDPEDSALPGIGYTCDSSTWSVESDEVLPMGFSADDAMAAIEGTTAIDAEIEGEGLTVLSITIMVADGALSFTDQSDYYTGDTAEGSHDCPDFLSVPVTVLLSTDDGSFDFDVDLVLRVEALDAFSVRGDIALEANAGTLAVEAPGPEITEQYFTLEHAVRAGAASGQLGLFEQGSNGETSWAGTETIMTWSPIDE